MDLKKYGQRPYIICSLLAVAAFGILWLACIIVDPSWDPSKNSISQLSVSPAAPLFKAACIVTAIFFAIYGIGKIIFDRFPEWLAGLFMVLGSVGLFFMSLFSKEYYDIHFITAAVAIVFFAMAIGTSFIGHYIKKRYQYAVPETVVSIVACIVYPLNWGIAQTITLFCIFLWVVLEYVFYMKEGKMENVCPQNDISYE